MSTNTTYAGRKRRKPIQKSAKAPVEGAKSNPSKRHRDRLNGELERMANLLPLPQDVISRLDKLTILRLSVSYLRAKSFFNVTLKSNSGPKPDGNGLKQLGGEDFLEGELLLQVLSGFVLVVTADGLVFFVSSTIQDYLGFHQTDVIHQSVYDLIHTEDRAEFQRQLHWSLNPNLSPETGQESPDGKTAALPVTYYRPEQLPPENSTFLERNFVCRLRCLLDNSSGFMAMTFQGRLKFLHGQSQKSKDGQPIPPQLALFALATPLQPPSILEIRTKNFLFRTKHKMDFTPTACDAKGKIVLGYTEAELSSRGSGYQFIHAADMLYCAENHIRMIKTGESGVTVFRLLTKQSRWVWVQANARLVYKNGRPDCIIASQRVITEEEGEEHVRKRNLRLPFCFTTGEAVLYDTNVIFGESDVDPSKRAHTVHPDSLLGSLMKQDESIYVCLPAQNQSSFQHGALADSGDDLDRILSGDWQDNVLSLSENGIFKPDIDSDVSMEDKSGDLLCFMKSLGICREDLELIQKDEEFLRVSVDNQDSLMDVEDEILSYLHESINRESDCIFANAVERKPDSGCATQLQQHGALPCLHQGQPLSLAQPAQPMTLLHQQTQTHPHQPITEQHLHTQIHPHQQNQQQYPCMQTQQPITHQQLQTQQTITHQQLQTQQPIIHQQLQTQQPIIHQQLQTQQPIIHQQLQTQQPITHQQLQTQQPIIHQQLQTQQPIIHQQLQTQQPIMHQQLHTQTQQPVAQQYFHAQGQQPNTQQHLHTQALQPITADHLHAQAQQPITQQNLHPQAHPLQTAPQQHALVQQQLPQQQLTQIDQQQQPYTQVHPHQNLHAQIHPQQHTPQQPLSTQAHPEELLLQQDQSLLLQKQQLLNLQQQRQPTVPQPLISHVQQPLPLQQLPQQPGYPPLQSPFPEQQRQLCHKMRQMQVNGKCQSVTQPPTTNGHPLPALFQAEQSFPEYGHLFLEGSGVEMPHRNQLNTLSITCNQEFSPYKIPEGLGTGDQSTPQDLEELLESLQPGALGQEQGGNSAPLCHQRALPMHQLLPETSGLARGQQLNPKLFTLSTLGNQPYLANFQNGDNGDMIQTHPESSNGIDLPQAALPLHQHPAEGRPFQNLTTGGFV